MRITIPEQRGFNEATGEFVDIESVTLNLEHSLFTISKWEQKYHKPFLESNQKTEQEIKDYIYCMIVDEDIPEEIVNFLTKENIDKITDYINNPSTATTFWSPQEQTQSASREKMTSELIYYQMISYRIPVEFEHWHIKRLLTLIRVFNIKNTPPKKRSAREIMQSNALLNEQRKKQLGTRG